MAQQKIEVLDAEIDGKRKGEVLAVDEKSAVHFVAIGYARKVSEPAQKPKPKGDKGAK